MPPVFQLKQETECSAEHITTTNTERSGTTIKKGKKKKKKVPLGLSP